jgi:hypothetical protein
MAKKICYMGDGNVPGAASYLCGIMTHFGLAFDYVPGSEKPPADFLSTDYAVYVLSDYHIDKFERTAMDHMIARVKAGAGLAMFGGWESFFGRSGGYYQSPLAEVLPVVMQSSDDRRNYAQPVLINKQVDHPILEGLPWDQPPGIGGFNAIEPKPEATLLLTSVQFAVRRTKPDGGFQFSQCKEKPLLIVGSYGEGRTTALATDVAPHWVGGFVDWGDTRVKQEIPGDDIDVGGWYAQFFRNLLVWTGKLDG